MKSNKQKTESTTKDVVEVTKEKAIDNDRKEKKVKGLYDYSEFCTHTDLVERNANFEKALNFKKFMGGLKVSKALNYFDALQEAFKLANGRDLETLISEEMESVNKQAEEKGFAFEERTDKKGNVRFGYFGGDSNPSVKKQLITANQALINALLEKGLTQDEIKAITKG